MATPSKTLSAPRPRHRDLWMAYTAQRVNGRNPVDYPNISGDPADTQDEDSTSESYHKISQVEEKRIQKVVEECLSPTIEAGKASESSTRPENKMASAVRRILELCEDRAKEAFPYDLVVRTDQEMEGKVADEDRIARVVCDQMLEIYDAMLEEQGKAQDTFLDHIETRRFSLRRVLYRFCRDADYFPTSLFLSDITLPPKTEVFDGASFSDIYRIDGPRGSWVALKTYRVFEAKSGRRHFSRALKLEAVILSRLKHDNLLPFVGLYKQSRKNIELTYIVSPWMDHGDILQCMDTLEAESKDIPRMRWISEVAYGLRYLHDECVVHGALHGRNILIDDKMHVRIADFDVSSLADSTTSAGITPVMTQSMTWWSAPDLAEEGALPTYASDVWSFGCACLLIWTGAGPYVKCTTAIRLLKMLMDTKRTPEDPEHPMSSFPKDNPDARSQGALLREKVALPCWSHTPENRPTMKAVEELLRKSFGST